MPIDRAFIQAGLTRYAEAKATLSAFQSEVYEALAEAFEHKTWQNFDPILEDGSLSIGRGLGITFIQSWISGTLTGREPQERITPAIGFFWNSPGPVPAVAAVAYAWRPGGGGVVPLRAPSSAHSPKLTTFKKGDV